MVKLVAGDTDTVVSSDNENIEPKSQQVELITVYLAYAEDAQRQHYLTLQVSHGATLYETLVQAGWLVQFTALALWCEQVANITTPTAKLWHVGIYAQKQPLNYQLQPFDRIEVYRSLSADPMSQRKSKSGG
ncbi:putative ubiquitin-RnfH superfamily antitoxin RatB of RatAB toxin-antitoxin module [Psychrobacter sp. PL15]|uniref:RnfH family protein n=1 Tax=unclassified Psychrobacter TaxID=196806 RepID=UPI001AE9A178|nr:RnfH family protein [Psychrobacter sp. PL15]MEC5210001.1 putative ubiquitin-RnfH superfamily antitoxin RatB of RatAB toxin-antitoxin module [Psychrobacter sp. PL15]